MSVMASWLCAQVFVQVQIKEYIKAPCHWPLWPVAPPHKEPVMLKMFPFDDVIMFIANTLDMYELTQVWKLSI